MKRLCASDKDSEPRRLRCASEPPNLCVASAAAPPKMPFEADSEYRPFVEVSGPEYDHQFFGKTQTFLDMSSTPDYVLSRHDDHFLSVVPGQGTVMLVHDDAFDGGLHFTLRFSNEPNKLEEILTAVAHLSPSFDHDPLGAQACIDAAGDLWAEVALANIEKGRKRVYISQYKGGSSMSHWHLDCDKECTPISYRSNTGRLALVVIDRGGLIHFSVPEAPALGSIGRGLLQPIDYNAMMHYNRFKKGLDYPELNLTTFSACAGPPGSGAIYTLAHAVDRQSNKFITIMGHDETDGRVTFYTSSPLAKWQTDVDALRMGWHLMQIASDGRLIVVYSVPCTNSIYAMSIIGVSSNKPVLVRSELKIADSIATSSGRWSAVLLPGDVIGVVSKSGGVVCFK